jgi:hypothetical protein
MLLLLLLLLVSSAAVEGVRSNWVIFHSSQF